MTWTNAFDLGACTVRVLSNGSYMFSGVLGKGETSGNFADTTTEATLSVDVSSDGVVSLNLVGGTDSGWKRLDVVPSYDIVGKGLRASLIALPQYVSGGYGFAMSSDDNPDNISLTFSEPNWSPDPVDVSALEPREGVLVGGGEGV